MVLRNHYRRRGHKAETHSDLWAAPHMVQVPSLSAGVYSHAFPGAFGLQKMLILQTEMES